MCKCVGLCMQVYMQVCMCMYVYVLCVCVCMGLHTYWITIANSNVYGIFFPWGRKKMDVLFFLLLYIYKGDQKMLFLFIFQPLLWVEIKQLCF